MGQRLHIRPLNTDGKEGKLLIFFPLKHFVGGSLPLIGWCAIGDQENPRTIIGNTIGTIFTFPLLNHIQGFGNGSAHWCIALGKQDGREKISGAGKGLFHMHRAERHNAEFHSF